MAYNSLKKQPQTTGLTVGPLLTFLSDLQANNNKPWMDSHKATYHAARKTVHLLTQNLLTNLQQIDPSLQGLTVADCIFRINRDVRFSHDKSPYKNNMGAYFAQGGKKSPYAGYYLHLQPNNQSFIAGGNYQPDPATLKQLRQEIDYNGPALQTIVNEPAFQQYFGAIQGASLQRPPLGYDAQHPYIDWLKLKSFIALHPLSDEQILRPDLIAYTTTVFRALRPFISFLNNAIGETLDHPHPTT